jgi:hypothetical protein
MKMLLYHPPLTITRVSNYTDSFHIILHSLSQGLVTTQTHFIELLKNWQFIYFTSLVYSLITPDSSVNKTNADNTGVIPARLRSMK